MSFIKRAQFIDKFGELLSMCATTYIICSTEPCAEKKKRAICVCVCTIMLFSEIWVIKMFALHFSG